MFKIGDKVVCIKTRAGIKINKIYTITGISSFSSGQEIFKYLYLYEGTKINTTYDIENFISLKEHRKQKLNRLNSI